MTDPVETGPVRHELDFGGQVVLWSIRLWVLGVCHQKPTHETIDRAYALIGCPDGARFVNAAMQKLTASARRVLDIRPPCFTAISDDEQRLLDAIRCFQRADKVRPRFIVSAISYRQAAPALLNALERLSQCLLLGGLVLQGEIACRTKEANEIGRKDDSPTDNPPAIISLYG